MTGATNTSSPCPPPKESKESISIASLCPRARQYVMLEKLRVLLDQRSGHKYPCGNDAGQRNESQQRLYDSEEEIYRRALEIHRTEQMTVKPPPPAEVLPPKPKPAPPAPLKFEPPRFTFEPTFFGRGSSSKGSASPAKEASDVSRDREPSESISDRAVESSAAESTDSSKGLVVKSSKSTLIGPVLSQRMSMTAIKVLVPQGSLIPALEAPFADAKFSFPTRHESDSIRKVETGSQNLGINDTRRSNVKENKRKAEEGHTEGSPDAGIDLGSVPPPMKDRQAGNKIRYGFAAAEPSSCAQKRVRRL